MKSTKFLSIVLFICILGFSLSSCSPASLPIATDLPSPTPTPPSTHTPTVSPSPSPSSSPTSEPTPSPSATPEPSFAKVGHWEGKGLFFDIAPDGNIHDLQIAIPMAEGLDCMVSMKTIIVPTDGVFSAGSPAPVGSGEINLISGKFLDPTSLSGVFGGSPIQCEVNNLTFFFQDQQAEIAFQATWINSLSLQEESFDGEWSGTTSAGRNFEFVVENNVVTSFLVEFDNQPGCDSPYQVLNAAMEITANTFSKTGLFSTIEGTFDTSTSASGELTLFCNSDLALTWTAGKNP